MISNCNGSEFGEDITKSVFSDAEIISFKNSFCMLTQTIVYTQTLKNKV